MQWRLAFFRESLSIFEIWTLKMSIFNFGYGLSEKNLPSFTTREGNFFRLFFQEFLTLCSETVTIPLSTFEIYIIYQAMSLNHSIRHSICLSYSSSES
jgi:hypothetical protein